MNPCGPSGLHIFSQSEHPEIMRSREIMTHTGHAKGVSPFPRRLHARPRPPCGLQSANSTVRHRPMGSLSQINPRPLGQPTAGLVCFRPGRLPLPSPPPPSTPPVDSKRTSGGPWGRRAPGAGPNELVSGRRMQRSWSRKNHHAGSSHCALTAPEPSGCSLPRTM